MAKTYNIAAAKGRIQAAKRCHGIALEIAESAAATPRDRLMALTSARQERADMRKEEGFVAPVDREWIAEQVRRAEEAAERIHGGRPRRVSPPGTAKPADTRH